MKKKDEQADPNSCLNKAKNDELIFVLLGRDRAAPTAILAWAKQRINYGLNKASDPQIIEALNLAKDIIRQQIKESNNGHA